jgi:hypothetical protein
MQTSDQDEVIRKVVALFKSFVMLPACKEIRSILDF